MQNSIDIWDNYATNFYNEFTFYIFKDSKNDYVSEARRMMKNGCEFIILSNSIIQTPKLNWR